LGAPFPQDSTISDRFCRSRPTLGGMRPHLIRPIAVQVSAGSATPLTRWAVSDGTVTLITAVESPQVPRPAQLATVSFSMPPSTLMVRLATEPQSRSSNGFLTEDFLSALF